MLIYWGIPYFTSNSIWIHRSIQLVLGISASRRGCSQQFWEALLVSPRCQPWLIVKKGVGEDVAMLIFTKNPAAMGRNSTLIAQLFSSSEWTIRLDRWAAPLASHHLEETLAAQKKKYHVYSRVDSREILLNLQPSMTGTAHLAGKLAGTAAALLKKKTWIIPSPTWSNGCWTIKNGSFNI
jgi:hypothetical protein